MAIYILFQTDVWKTRNSRICFGVFSSEVQAIEAAKANDLYSHEAEVDIVEVELDEFVEFM